MKSSSSQDRENPLISQEVTEELRRSVSADKPAVVILDMGVPGLYISRLLGRKNIPVVALDTKEKHWTHYSRYNNVISTTKIKDNQVLLETLLGFGKALEHKPVLIPLHDDYVKFVSQNRELLAEYFRFVLPSKSSVETVVDKRQLDNLCLEKGIVGPKTYYPDNLKELQQLEVELVYPCIYKPAESRSWQSASAQEVLKGKKAVEVTNSSELFSWYERLCEIDPRLLVQEVIPGPDRNLYYTVSYIKKDGTPYGFFVGRKLRTYPIHFGQGSYVESVPDNGVVKLSEEIIELLDYKGNIGLEFKEDPRDGLLKLIEINARFGLWDGFAAECGLDVAYAHYADACGKELDKDADYKRGCRWLDIDRDLWAAIQYRRSGELGIKEWLGTLVRPHFSPIFVRDDIKPGIVYLWGFAKVLISRIVRRFIPGSRNTINYRAVK